MKSIKALFGALSGGKYDRDGDITEARLPRIAESLHLVSGDMALVLKPPGLDGR